MGTLTFRPSEQQHLISVATSLDKPMEERTAAASAQFDMETRFRLLASRGSVEKGLGILDTIDQKFA
ncbi:MAG: hypothetical protein HW380_3531 [Magnetococcales bacterium]|nr:hypothetical protein [Magnetococcales bacterium]